MSLPSPSYIASRAVMLIALVAGSLLVFSFAKKKQRQAGIIAGLRSITSDSSFFRQFYAEDARKTLVRAVGLIAEANSLGMPPDEVIDRGMGIKPGIFENDAGRDDPPMREIIIRRCLRGNYENFLKLGYTADFHTLDAMRNGNLPPIPAGPESGGRAEIAHLIGPSACDGIDKVLANLEILPPAGDGRKSTDIEIAAARQLARDLATAGVIEEGARDRILDSLSQAKP